MTYLLLALKYWRGCLIALLAFLILCLLMILNYKDEVIEKQKQEHISYAQQQTELNLRMQLEAQNQIIQSEKTYNEKIKQISHDSDIAHSRVDSLSKQLTLANSRLKKARREAIEEYSRVQSNVLTSCITEYRNMAKIADENGADAERVTR